MTAEDPDQPEQTLTVYEDQIEGIRALVADKLPHNVDLTSLFSTSQGKLFAEQIVAQKQFTFIGMLLPMVMELAMKVLPHLGQILTNVKIQELLERGIEKSDEMKEELREVARSLPDFTTLEFRL